MPGPEPQPTVKVVSQGDGAGFLIPIARKQIRAAGLDPERPIEADRAVFETDRPTIRLRLRNVDGE